jgi:hypothetical protein
MNCEEKLLELIAKVEKVSPQLADRWQATAIVESLGYTDRLIELEFGFADALSLGQYIYDRHKKSIAPAPQKTTPRRTFIRRAIEEISIFIDRFAHSFIYAVPLLVSLLLQYIPLNKTTELLPPELNSLLTLATMASLSTSGGFVQMISRRGEFYFHLGELRQARRVCLSLLYLGIATSILLGTIGLYFGFYRGLFADRYLILATLYYLLLSILWMLLATLSTQWRWGSPLILLTLTALFVFLRVGIGIGALEAQILAMAVALAFVMAIVAIVWRKSKESGTEAVELPRQSVVVYLLFPYFCYGIAYFSFIFADRVAAGLAIDPASGLLFAIDSQYQKGMDLALFNFLVFVPLIEYLGYRLIRYWYRQAKILSVDTMAAFSQKLRQRYWLMLVVTVLLFGVSSEITIGTLKPPSWGISETIQAIIGCLGYLFFVIGLLNALILFSLNRAIAVLQTLLPSLVLNFLLGYFLAHLLGVYWASTGLVIGAAVFVWFSGKKVLQAISQPDYAYYLGGY